MSWTNASVPVPKLQLCGFQRQLLKVNVTAIFNFVVTSEQMAVWISNAEGFQVELGKLDHKKIKTIQCDFCYGPPQNINV